jgi:hypothetical protein
MPTMTNVDFNPSDVAGYMAASLTKTARECQWPDNAFGNAARLLIQDLGEFGQAIVACGRANFWSPAKALERMFLERVEVLMGAGSEERVATRYLDSVVTANIRQGEAWEEGEAGRFN